jgi:hypothetical protein
MQIYHKKRFCRALECISRGSFFVSLAEHPFAQHLALFDSFVCTRPRVHPISRPKSAEIMIRHNALRNNCVSFLHVSRFASAADGATNLPGCSGGGHLRLAQSACSQPPRRATCHPRCCCCSSASRSVRRHPYVHQPLSNFLLKMFIFQASSSLSGAEREDNAVTG